MIFSRITPYPSDLFCIPPQLMQIRKTILYLIHTYGEYYISTMLSRFTLLNGGHNEHINHSSLWLHNEARNPTFPWPCLLGDPSSMPNICSKIPHYFTWLHAILYPTKDPCIPNPHRKIKERITIWHFSVPKYHWALRTIFRGKQKLLCSYNFLGGMNFSQAS